MDQGGTPEKGAKPSMDQLARQAADEIIAKYTAQWDAISAEKNPEEQRRMREDLARQVKDELTSKIRLQTEEAPGTEKGEDKSQDPKEQAKEAKKTFLEVSEMKEHGVEVLDKSSQALADSIAQRIKTGDISDQEAVDIINAIGKQLVDGVVFSKGDQQKSTFEQNLEALEKTNKSAADKIKRELREHSASYGLNESQANEKFGGDQEDQQEALRKMIEEQGRRRGGPDDAREAQFEMHDKPLYSRFTEPDQQFLKQFYKVDTFEALVNDTITKKAQHEAHGGDMRREIIKIYQETNRGTPSQSELQQILDKQIRIEAAEDISKRLIDIMNKLYWRVHNERPHKFFEEIEKEDFMYGIEATRMKIANALESLQHTLEDQEVKDAKEGKAAHGFRLFKNVEKPYFIDEKDIFMDGRHVSTKPYMRLSPLPEFQEISLSEYVKSIIKNMDHWRHRSEYLHNARAIFNHPAHGDKGFFSNLGGYAENLSGTDIDEMMLLPDGKIVFDAYILYDKLVEEEFASQDWKHRPNQFTNSLEEVNTKVEKEVIKRLHLLHGEESLDALQNAVNAAVGMARGVFLTETEKSAYADAVDPTGGGMFASYATNDATALQTFNPLHVMLRWQGEHMMPMFYFMENRGSGATWDHNKTWLNAKQYFETFKAGRGQLGDKKLFIDDLIDNMNVGGVLKRKGWRLAYALEGHKIYEKKAGPDGVVRTTNELNYIETFKAMDVIGYEAIYDFLQADIKNNKDLLKARAGSADAAKMDGLFKHIFDRYFVPFGEKDYQAYIDGLRAKGEERANKVFKDKGAFSAPKFSMDDEINYQTALTFMENALAREVGLRFPSKFLRMDRDRFTKNGLSRYSQVVRELGWDRDKFNDVMRDFSLAELMLRREISDYAKRANQLFPDKKLNDFNNFEYIVNDKSIERVLAGKLDASRIKDVVTIWQQIQKNFLSNKEFMNGKAFGDINKYTFTFGIEDTDFTLMAMRATGPRMIARSINDTGQMESITPWIINMPRLLNQIATSGKHDFTPIIEYLQKAQNAYTSVHGTGADFAYIYRIAAATIQYFKKDSIAKPLFGLFGINRKNSIAAEYAGRGGAVWEWDAKDIDSFIVAMETLRLLPKDAFKMDIGPKVTDRYIKLPFMKKPVKFGTKRIIDYEWNGDRLRKEFGADAKAIAIEMINTILPTVLIFVLWQYIKKALDEAEGKKK